MKGVGMADIALRFGVDVLAVDGNTTSMLKIMGFEEEPCVEILNILEPESIAEVHRAYVNAGAQCIVTNTYGASENRLAYFGQESLADTINYEGVMIAKSVKPEHVLASVGPCGIKVLSDTENNACDTSYGDAFFQYSKQIKSLAKAEPDAILIETFTNFYDAKCALMAAKNSSDLPVFVSCCFDESGIMPESGTSIETTANELAALKADVFGLNCLIAPNEMLELVKRLKTFSDLPLMVRPDLDEKITIDELAYFAKEFRAAGAQFIGTCCGSSPKLTGVIFAEVANLSVV
jgi:5-methyltetrahydrofolate--homocysteine methyltransferase